MAKELTVEQAEQDYLDAKEAAKNAWDQVTAYKKKHKLKPGYKPEKDEVGKGYKALISAHKEAKEAREEAEAKWKSIKPKGVFGRTGPTKYDYPEGMSKEEKKKFRAQARAAAKREAKGETAPAKAKAKVKVEAPEAPAKTTKKVAKKVVKKAAKPVADEDED